MSKSSSHNCSAPYGGVHLWTLKGGKHQIGAYSCIVLLPLISRWELSGFTQTGFARVPCGNMGPISPPCGHAGNVKPLKNAFIVDRAVVALDHRSSEDRGGSRSGSREHRRVHGSHWHPVRLNLMCESEASVAYVLSSHHSSIIRSIPTADQVVRSYVWSWSGNRQQPICLRLRVRSILLYLLSY